MKSGKTRLIAFLTSLILILGVFSLATFAETAEPRLLVLGDSIVTGYGLSDYNTSKSPRSANSFAALLVKKLGYSFTSGAKDGQTTDGLLTAVKTDDYKSAVKSSDTVVICIGANDLLNVFEPIMGSVSESALAEFMGSYQSRLNTAVNTASSNISAIVKQVKSQNSKATIVIQTLYNPFEFFDFELYGGKTADDVAQAAVEQLNTAIRKIASTNKIILCDIFKIFDANPSADWLKTSCKSREDFLSGKASLDIHPTAKGHAGIFNLVYSALGMNNALYEFTGYKSFGDIKIAYGIAKEDIPMPKTATLVTTRGNVDVDVISWDLSGYDQKTVSSQKVEVTAKYKMPSFILNDRGLPTKVTATLAVASAPSLLKIIEPQAITGITCGTSLDYIGLPAQVTIIAGENKNEYQANVVWDTAAYDPTRLDAYKLSLTGAITLPEGVSNEDNLPLTVSILLSIEASQQKDPATQSAGTTAPPVTEPKETSAPETTDKAPEHKSSAGKIIFWIIFIPIMLFILWIIIVRIIKEKRRRERARRRAARRRAMQRQYDEYGNEYDPQGQYYDDQGGQYFDDQYPQNGQYYDDQYGQTGQYGQSQDPQPPKNGGVDKNSFYRR